MIVYFILLGLVIYCIVPTLIQIKSAHKKEIIELMQLFEDSGNKLLM